jgi:hypothetical protein
LFFYGWVVNCCRLNPRSPDCKISFGESTANPNYQATNVAGSSFFIENTREVCHVVVVYSVGYRHMAAVQQLWLLWIPSIQLLYFVGTIWGYRAFNCPLHCSLAGNNFRRPVVGMVRLVVVTAPQ